MKKLFSGRLNTLRILSLLLFLVILFSSTTASYAFAYEGEKVGLLSVSIPSVDPNGTGYIGALVKKYESGTKGSLNCSHSGNDFGLSCGSYQLTLRWGNCIEFLKYYFADKPSVSALYFNYSKADIASPTWPGDTYCSSPDTVKAVWEECYYAVGVNQFFAYEHDYITRAYYEPVLKELAKVGFNPNRHSRMAQECMWSWAVHKGAGWNGSGGAIGPFKEACAGINPQTTLAFELIDLLYDKRYSVNQYDRYSHNINYSERVTLREHCDTMPLEYKGTSPSDGTASGVTCDTNLYGILRFYVPTTSVYNGVNKFYVKWVQSALKILGYYEKYYQPWEYDSIVDGDFGARTTSALKDFQNDNGLNATGVCDFSSTNALIESLKKYSFGFESGNNALSVLTYVDKVSLLDDSQCKMSGGYINGLPDNCTALDALHRFKNRTLSFFDKNGNTISSEAKIGTGASVKLVSSGKTLDSVIVVVKGDTDGDGLISASDYLQIKLSLRGLSSLKGAFALASDINGNGTLSVTDYLRVKAHCENKINLLLN